MNIDKPLAEELHEFLSAFNYMKEQNLSLDNLTLSPSLRKFIDVLLFNIIDKDCGGCKFNGHDCDFCSDGSEWEKK